MHVVTFILLIGIGATAVMDVWSLVRKHAFDVPLPNYGLVGRWLGHMRQGKFCHVAITASAPVPHEKVIGWIAHYVIGITFAALLIAIAGEQWMAQPSVGPAIAVGLGTVAAPFLLMQPGMGAGIAASKTPHPRSARAHSVITHLIFGVGLYVSGWGVALCVFG